MADSVVRLTVNSSEYDQKLKRAAEGLTRYADECRKVGGTMEVVEKDTLEYVRALGQMDTVSRTATGKLSEMKKTFTELSVVYKNMTDEEKNSPFGKALATSLDQLKGRIQDSKSQLDDINKSVNGGGGLTGALDAVAGKFGLSIDQVTKFGGVVGVATTAVQVAKDAFFQSESNIDEWGRTVEGAKGAYSLFLDTLNNGNWSNFFQNLSAAIRGGRDLYDVFDRLGSIKSNNAAAIAITQKEIAELRLAKQQGENVDAKLKAATERLAALQKQSVSAGMAAGSTSAFQTIRNGVNSIGGAGVNDATIKYAVGQIMKNGQSEFDKYAQNVKLLEQRGTKTRNEWYTDNLGIARQRPVTDFQISNLSQVEQRQYALAKAITEGETRIQQGISAYAQAIQEGTSSAREEFKGNRYALQGAGSGGGRSGGSSGRGGSIKTDQTELQKNQQTINELTQEYVNISDNANEATRARQEEIRQEIQLLEQRNNLLKLYAEQAQGKLQGGDVQTTGLGSGSFWGSFKDMKIEGLSDDQMEKVRKGMASMNQTAKESQKTFMGAASAVSAMGGALSSIKDPGVQIMGMIGQAIASIALGFAQASAKEGKGGIWYWIAATAAGLATMIATISSIHSATGYAQGGIVKGNSYSGDNIYGGPDAMVNAGELVLTRAQQSTLAGALQGGGLQNMNIAGRIKGTDIILSIDRSLKLEGKQLLTWGR